MLEVVPAAVPSSLPQPTAPEADAAPDEEAGAARAALPDVTPPPGLAISSPAADATPAHQPSPPLSPVLRVARRGGELALESAAATVEGASLVSVLLFPRWVVLSVVFAVASISLTLMNHSVVIDAQAPLSVVCLTTLASTFVSAASCKLRFGSGTLLWATTVPPLFMIKVMSSMVVFEYVPLGTFVVVRNLGPLVSLAVEAMVSRDHDLLSISARLT